MCGLDKQTGNERGIGFGPTLGKMEATPAGMKGS